MRIKFVSLGYNWTTPRGYAGFMGAVYNLDQAYLRAALDEAGFSSLQYVDQQITGFAQLMRGLCRGGDIVVLDYGANGARQIVERLADAICSSKPSVRVIFSGVSGDDQAQLLEDHQNVFACLSRHAEREIVELTTALEEDREPARMEGMSFREQTDVGIGARGVSTLPNKVEGGLLRVPSPYLKGMLPADAAASLGVETCRRAGDVFEVAEATTTRVAHHTFARVLDELLWIDRHASGDQTVRLRGELFTSDVPRAKALCEELNHSSMTQVKLSTSLDPLSADEDLIKAMSSAGFSDCTYYIDLSDPSSVDSDTLVDRVYDLVEAAENAGVSPKMHIIFGPTHEESLESEQLVSEIAAVCPDFTYEWPQEDPAAIPPHEALYLPEITSSSTFNSELAMDHAEFKRFQRMVTGLYEHSDNYPPAYVESTHDLLWDSPSSPGDSQEWLEDTLSFDSALFRKTKDLNPQEVTPSPLGEIHILSEDNGDGSGEGDVTHPYGRGDYVLNNREKLSTIGYLPGRDLLPTGRLLLSIDKEEDIHAFLEDADTAKEQGIFPKALFHPLTFVLDMCRWGGPGQCATPRLPRLVVDSHGSVRPAPLASPVGQVGDSFESMLGKAKEEADDTRRRRACDLCPVYYLCSACQCLPEWIPEEDYCAWRKERPWLASYASVPMAIERLATIHPWLAGDSGVEELLVSGFGGSLYYDGESIGHSVPLPPLLKLRDEHYIFIPTTQKTLHVTADLAMAYETLVYAPDEEMAIKWLAERTNFSLQKASEALEQARKKLSSVKVVPQEISRA